MNCPCELPEAGERIYDCERLGCRMTPHYCKLYQTREDYRNSWNAGRGPAQNLPDAKPQNQRARKKRKPTTGPGTELKRLLRWVGITDTGCGGCGGMAGRMDRMGSGACREMLDLIVGHLEKQAARRNLPFSRFAATKLVRLAIWKAERKANV